MLKKPDVTAADDAVGKAVKPAKKSSDQKAIDELNERYCVVQDGNRIRVHSFERYERRGHVRLVSTFLPFHEFRNLFMNRTVKHGDEGYIDIGELWLRSRQRRQYSGITFQPGGTEVINGKLNLWRGFGVAPVKGNWSLMRQHLEKVLANGDAEKFEYLLRWLAWAVQNPDRQAEVCLVFKGKAGTGKGTLGNTMCRIFGQHAVHISSAAHLTGHFNSHLRDACFLFADESYWPGDKSAEGSLKRLVSEPTLIVEGKGRDSIEVSNMLHVVIASNEEWVVPANERERRYVAYDVPDIRIQQESWFAPLYKQMEDGGYNAMLFDLLHYDLGSWHPRKLPSDTGLLEQQRRSLGPLDSWWIELLENGVLAGCDPDQPNRARSGKWHKKIDGEAVNFESTRLITMPGLLDEARNIEPKLKNHFSNNRIGDYLRDRGCSNKHRVLRERGWTFPPLAELRREWEIRFPNWPWRNPSITDWQPEEDDDAPAPTLAKPLKSQAKSPSKPLPAPRGQRKAAVSARKAGRS